MPPGNEACDDGPTTPLILRGRFLLGRQATNANGFRMLSGFTQLVEWHGMATSFGLEWQEWQTRTVGNEVLYVGHKPSSLCVPTHPVRAEGVGLEPTSPCGQRFSRPRSTLTYSHDLFCFRLNLPIHRGVQPDPSRIASSSSEKGMSRECHSERASLEHAGSREGFAATTGAAPLTD